MVIDAHHHFWRYDSREYGWIGEEMGVLRRDFLPGDLKREIEAAGVEGVVSVQARQTLDETRWLLGMAEENEFIRGVVGWMPLVSERVEEVLGEFAGRKKLKGVRHVLQDEAEEGYMLRADFDAGVGRLKKLGLVYDILIYERQLPQAIELVDRHPGQVFVLDHVGKPRIREGGMEPWRENMRELAKRGNVYCKVSGMVTEAEWRGWSVEQLRVYAEVVLEAFGAGRVMFGSDWPVCLVACGYGRWRQVVGEFVSKLSETERKRVMGKTAVEAYRL